MRKLGTLDVAGEKYTLALGETYLIGVKSDDFAQDIEIDDASVDLKHCIVDCLDKSLKIVDIRSKCGTFVDGVQIGACQMVPLLKSVTLHFGKVEAYLQLNNESEKCFPEQRTSPPRNDDSEIVCNSPEHVSVASSRMRHAFHTTSSLNVVPSTTSIELQNPNKSPQSFATCIDKVRRSTASNTSAKSSDSFCIPETQCVVGNQSKPNDTLDDNNQSKVTFANINDDNDDYFIPETQEIVGMSDKLARYPRVAFHNESVNETMVDGEKIPSSQFRICTQEFNGSENGNSNDSEDILANITCSMAIPAIRHSPVQIDKLLDINSDEEEIEREMSALQWSKKSDVPAEASVTPDDVVTPDISVTPDIITEVVECQKVATLQDLDVVPNPEQPAVQADENEPNSKKNNEQPSVLEQDLLPTQLFVKPQSMPASKSKAHAPKSNKKNKVRQKDDSCFLAPTQVFSPSLSKVKHTSLQKASPKSPQIAEDDLPPTQVFEKISSAPAPESSRNTLLSSTLLDSGLQLSESSFRARCNKLLDSDDDEMDEIIAPELAKKVQSAMEKTQQPPEPTLKSPNIEKQVKENAADSLSKEKLVEKQIATPKSKVLATKSTAKKSSRPQPAVRIDDFLFTPDFVAKEFSKGEKLQELAEMNWKKLVSSKQRRNLFGDDEISGKLLSTEFSTAQDSGIDLNPETEKRKKSSSTSSNLDPENPVEKNASAKKSPAQPAERVSRRRKSTMPEEIKNKLPRQTKSRTEKDSNTKTELSKTDDKSEKSDKKSNMETESKDSDKKDNETEEKLKLMGRERIKLRRMRMDISEESEKQSDKTKNETSPPERTKRATSKRRTKSRHHTKNNESPVADVNSKQDTRQTSNESMHHSKDKESLVADGSNKIETKEPENKTKADVNNKKSSKRQLRSEKKSSPTPSRGGSSEKIKTAAAEKTREATTSKIKEEEKPALRLTRLQSRMDSTTLTKDEAPIEIVKTRKTVAASDDTSIKVVNEAPTNDATPVIDLINSDSEETIRKTRSQNEKTSHERSATEVVSGTTVTKTEKRKNGTTDTSSKKRIKSALEKTAPGDGSNSFLKSRTAKLKIAMTMCDPRYQVLLEKHSGSLWIYSRDPKECDVLVVEKGNRTYKLMVAIARGVPIVRLNWFIEVLKTKSVDVSLESHIFDEPEFQARHHFDIRKTLSLAKTKSLFKGMAFMMTPSIRPIPEEMKDIVTCSGGTVIEQIPKTNTNQRIYLISQTSDNQYWHKYRRSNANIKIVTSEGVMASVMQQSEKPLIESIIQ